jgi:membrane-bound metal-dependent hydrolase YbcI (DUF457 family)
MPSPIGHALGALAAGWTVLPAAPPERGAGDGRTARWRAVRPAALLVAVSLLPDLDLLVDAHSRWTHSVGAVGLVFLAAWIAGRGRQPRLAAAVALAYATHPLLDWLGQDGTPPYGVTAAWPFSDHYFHSGADLFTGISRRYWLPGFVAHNVAAVAREVVLLGPLAVAAWWWQRLRARRLPERLFLPHPGQRAARGESLDRDK